MNIITPSGFTVELKDSLTYGDRREIKRIMTDQLKIEVGEAAGKIEPFTASVMADIEEELFKRLIVGISDANGLNIEGDLLQVVYSWNEADGQAVFDAINEHFNSNTQKKIA